MKKLTFFKFFIIGVFVTVLYIALFERERAAILSFVAATNNQLTTLKNFKHELEKANEKLLNVAEKYLIPLGFKNDSTFYPEDFNLNISLPVIVTYVMCGHQDQAVSFAKNIAKVLPSYVTFMYDVGLQEYELYLLQNFCENHHCTVINLNWDRFPSYIKHNADTFRPIIIQDALNKAGFVFFVEPSLRFVSSNISWLIEKAYKNSVVASRTLLPTSSITHPRMYEYFQMKPENFYFVPSVDPTKMLIYNTYEVHHNIMAPWIKCTLVKNCIFPVGAQDSGCSFNKKPLYRYSGCHKIAMAPISIILGMHFDSKFELYSYMDNQLFYNITEHDAKLELSMLVKNSTNFIKNIDT